jgi:hypothetical protein
MIIWWRLSTSISVRMSICIAKMRHWLKSATKEDCAAAVVIAMLLIVVFAMIGSFL